MKLLLSALLLCAALTPVPVTAQDLSEFGVQEMLALGSVSETDNLGRILDDLVGRGLAFVRDHVEITQRYHEGRTGDNIGGEMEIKVYPQGKEQSEESFKGIGSFEFTRRPGGVHLRFDFNVLSPPPERRLDDYL